MGDSEADLSKSIRDRLKAINETLEKLIASFDAQPFSAQTVRDLVTTLLVSKMELLSALPELLGVSFFSWYLDLATLNELLDRVRHQAFNEPFDFQKEKDRIMGWLEEAKKTKEKLEKELPGDTDENDGKYGPSLKRIRKHLEAINERLARLIKGYPIGQYTEDDLRRLLYQCSMFKHQIVHLLLPTAIRVPFSEWYDVLRDLDHVASDAAEEAAKEIPNRDRIKRSLERAKEYKEQLERQLAN